MDDWKQDKQQTVTRLAICVVIAVVLYVVMDKFGDKLPCRMGGVPGWSATRYRPSPFWLQSSSALLLCCSPRCRSAGSPSRRKTLTPARASSEPRSSPQLSRRFRKFPAWKAAMAPSAAAVTSCRRGFARVSPAAKTPGRLVRQPSSART